MSELGKDRQGSRATPPPWLTLLTPPNPDSKTGGLTLLVAKRPYRSKYVTVTCFCRRRRKDGTCRTLDGVTPFLAHPDRTRYSHPKIDEQTFRVPPRVSSQFDERASQIPGRVSGHKPSAPDGATDRDTDLARAGWRAGGGDS